MKRLGIAGALAFLVAAAPAALAQPADEMQVEAARRLGQEGIGLYQEGQYEAAVDRLERAFRVVQVPTLGLWAARALEKSGRLVEAAERYRQVQRLKIEPGDPEVFRKAQAEAREEGEVLQALVPQLTVAVDGADANEVTLTIDGKPVSSALIGVPVSVNPGTRRIEATRDGQVVTQEVRLTEGQRASALLAFGSAAAPPGPAAAPAGGAGNGNGSVAEPSPARDAGVDPGSTQRTLAWVALGVGGAGLLAGTITGFSARSKQRDLQANCPDNQCEPAFHDDVDSFQSTRTLSYVGFGVGAVGLGAGLALLLTAPSSEESAGVTPWVGLASAGVRGRF